jgi:hypothetical protein
MKISDPTIGSGLNNNFFFSEIFTHLLAKDAWRKSSSSQDFLVHPEAANASPSQEDSYISVSHRLLGSGIMVVQS